MPWHSDWSCAVSVLSGDPTRDGLFLNLGTGVRCTSISSYGSGAWIQIYDLSAADGPYRKLLIGITPIRVIKHGRRILLSVPSPIPDIRLGIDRLHGFTTGPVLLYGLLNLCLALIIGWRLASHCGCSINQPPFCYSGILPRGFSFYVGQIQIMLAWVYYRVLFSHARWASFGQVCGWDVCCSSLTMACYWDCCSGNDAGQLF